MITPFLPAYPLAALLIRSTSTTSQEMDRKGEPMADWSGLPFDVLEHLTSFLPLPDYHRFSAVCRNWGLAAKARRHSPAKQLPWLLVRGDSDPHKYRVFSISENRHYNIHFPELQGQYVCGSSYGWLFIMGIDLNFRLLNPLTGKHYDLPPVPPISDGQIRFVREHSIDPNEMTYEDAQAGVVYKAILDYDPAQRTDFTVLILYGDGCRRVAFWRPGNLVWTLVEGDYYSLDDIAYFEGHFYGIDTDTNPNRTVSLDISVTYVLHVGPNPKVTQVAPIVPQKGLIRTYLVDFRGELLLVQRYRPLKAEGGFLTTAFFVYTLNTKEGTYYQRHHLDGYSLFLGHNSPSIVDHSQFPGCNENCIYFTAHVDCPRMFGRDDNGIYDMVKGTILPYYPPKIFHPEITGPTWWTPNPW